MKFGTLDELVSFAKITFEPQTAKELEVFLFFALNHTFAEVLSRGFALDIRPSTITTKEPSEANFEAHKKMWDLQLIFSGKEGVAVLPLEKAGSLTKSYDSEGDIEFYGKASELAACLFTLERGNAIFLAPCDAHAPCLTAESTDNHDKIVVKIPVTKEI